MEDAFTGSLVLALLSVVAFAYAGLRRVGQAKRAPAGPHRADGGRARIDAAEAMALAAMIDAQALGWRTTGRAVERWLVRAVRRIAAAPPGDEAEDRLAFAVRSASPSCPRRRDSRVGI